MNVSKISQKLYEIGAVKFGSFTLKSGIESPFYLDVRQIISYPELLKEISDLLFEKVRDRDMDLICGVPYTALPLASCISINENIPMCIRRKETKQYGTKKKVEGNIQKGQRCLVVEDVITSGASLMETVEDLHEAGLVCNEAVVFIEREQGGVEKLAQLGITVVSALKVTDIMKELKDLSLIDLQSFEKVTTFLHEQNQALKPECVNASSK